MTTQQTINIPELRKLLADATPGPWKAWQSRTNGKKYVSTLTDLGLAQINKLASPDDGALIAAAVNALPALLDAAEREQRLREALQAVVNSFDAPHRVSRGAAVVAARAALETTRGLDTPAETV